VPLYLGLDSSTQSLTAMLLEIADFGKADPGGARSRAVIFEHSIPFDTELPHYGTEHGVLPNEDPSVAVSSPFMWAEALDRMFEAIVASGLDLSRLAAIGGAAQQHGSVYMNAHATNILAGLIPSRPLVEQLRVVATGDEDTAESVLSRRVAPIWMDSSTSEECGEITAAIGGADRLAQLTGSRAFERFTGPQIRKFYKQDPAGWEATDRVHMVSSFMASLLVGGHAPLDPGDASGMNLMDLHTRHWSEEALDATAPDLAAKLPAIVPSSTIVGELAPYWQQRFGLPPAKIVAWSGDNPCSLVGTGLIREGQIAVSLGTSDTLFGLMREPRVDRTGTGHVFGSATGDYMGLTCFLNGALARQRIRDEHELDWDGFSEALRATPAGNGGALMFPWFEPEITPDVRTSGVRRIDLDAGETDRNVRAVVEAQMMALANHSRWMGVDVDVIHATGGAAVNGDILQVMADVFGAEVRRFEVGNSACLGAALRACHADVTTDGRDLSWEEVVRGIAEPADDSAIVPQPSDVETYARLRRRYAKLEPLAISEYSG
jgi:xylulokinase